MSQDDADFSADPCRTVGHRGPGILGAIADLANPLLVSRHANGGRAALTEYFPDARTREYVHDRVRDPVAIKILSFPSSPGRRLPSPLIGHVDISPIAS